jgi:hypothetical protein
VKCQLCEEKLNISEITCPVCGEKQNIANNEIVNYIIYEYKEYQNKIIQFKKDSYYDNYKTKAIKNTSIEIFEEIVSTLEYAIKEFTNVKISDIQIEEHYVRTPRVCDLNSNKICNGCGNC